MMNLILLVISPETMISDLETFIRLSLAMVLGGLIGLERERKSWFAGLRTHMLVCTGSTLIMIVSQYGFEGVLHRELVVLDPSRIAAQVVSGIGFLGAGTILFWKNMIRGLTTAASLWAVAAVGLAIGGGLYLAAISSTFLIIIVLAGIKPIENMFLKKQEIKEVKFTVQSTISLITLESLLKESDLSSDLVNLKIENENKKEHIQLFFRHEAEGKILKFIDALKKIPNVNEIEFND